MQKFNWIFLIIPIVLFSCGDTPEKPTGPERVIPTATKGTVDIEGINYSTLKWDDGLLWLGQNLSVETENSWCYESGETCPELGRLYRWDAANSACAQLGEGWRLPTAVEWENLAMRFGGYQDWFETEPTGDPILANNALLKGGDSGLAMRLTGRRGSNGGFEGKGEYGFYWTSTPVDDTKAVSFQVQKSGASVNRREANTRLGFLCRCLK